MAKKITVGSTLTVKFLKGGVSAQGKKWQCFIKNASQKRGTGTGYEKIGSFVIFVDNPIELKENDEVIVQKIISSDLTKEYYNGKEYIKNVLNCELTKKEDAMGDYVEEDTSNFDFNVDDTDFNL